MWLIKPTTVQLFDRGRYFTCPHCSVTQPHPPFDIELYTIGYAFCWFCVLWLPIEGGDRLGIILQDDPSRPYTSLKDDQGRPKGKMKIP
jgi:hypothetical protein